MASSIERLIAKSQEQLKMRPVLPFGIALKPGDIGVIANGAFSPRGTAKAILGIGPGRTIDGAPVDMSLTSGRDVRITTVIEGTRSALFPAIPVEKARIEVALTRKDSFLIATDDVVIKRLADPSKILKRMLAAYKRKTWRRNYVMVYEVAIPKSALILAAREGGTNLAFTASGTLPAGGVPLANLAGSVELAAQSHDLIKFESVGQVPVFYNAFNVSTDFWSGSTIVGPEMSAMWRDLSAARPRELRASKIPLNPV